MKPTFVFLPGAWHLPDYFNTTINLLSAAGYPSVAVQPAVLNSAPPALSFLPDTVATVDAIVPLLQADTDVIVVAHSYAGIYGTEAVAEVAADRYPGKIRRLVYVAAYVPQEGQSLSLMNYEAMGPDYPVLEFMGLDAGGYMVLNDAALEVFYHDVPEPDRSQYTALLGEQPVTSITTTVTREAWRDVPTTYVHTIQDRAIPLEMQQSMVKSAQDSRGRRGPGRPGGSRHEVRPFSGDLGVFTMDCGHSPMLAKTDEFVDILLRVGEGR